MRRKGSGDREEKQRARKTGRVEHDPDLELRGLKQPHFAAGLQASQLPPTPAPPLVKDSMSYVVLGGL